MESRSVRIAAVIELKNPSPCRVDHSNMSSIFVRHPDPPLLLGRKNSEPARHIAGREPVQGEGIHGEHQGPGPQQPRQAEPRRQGTLRAPPHEASLQRPVREHALGALDEQQQEDPHRQQKGEPAPRPPRPRPAPVPRSPACTRRPWRGPRRWPLPRPPPAPPWTSLSAADRESLAARAASSAPRSPHNPRPSWTKATISASRKTQNKPHRFRPASHSGPSRAAAQLKVQAKLLASPSRSNWRA